jgi:hypothetical protein
MPSKIVQIATGVLPSETGNAPAKPVLYALFEDGTIWQRFHDGKGWQWQAIELPVLPADT